MRKNTAGTIYENINTQSILLIGDIHGAFGRLKDIIRKNDVNSCCLICVGDLGIGFNYSQEGEIHCIKELNKFFAERSIIFLSIAGNHDNPAYFDGSINLSHFKLIPDYTSIKLNGEDFLFVGGAVSIDRRYRVLNKSYWADETFVLKPELVKKCDVLITHSAPYWVGPFDKDFISSWCEKDPTLWDECRKERLEIDELIKLSQPKRAFTGHFHQSAWVDFRGCYARILNIEEVVEHIPIKDSSF